MKPVSTPPKWYQKIDAKLNVLSDQYTKELGKWFDRKTLMSGIALMLIALSALAVWKMPQVLLPIEDTGFVEVTSPPPTGVGRLYHLDNNEQLNSVFKGDESVEANLSYIEGTPTNHVLLKPWGERDQSADELVNEFIAKAQSSVSAYGMSFKVRSADNLNIATNMILELTAVNRDTGALSETASKVVEALEDYEGVTNVKNSMLRDQLRYDLSIDRNAIVLSGVDYGNVTNALSTFLGSVKAADLQADDGYTYPIQVQVNLKDLGDFKVLDKLYVDSQSGQRLPLSQFVSIKQVTSESNF